MERKSVLEDKKSLICVARLGGKKKKAGASSGTCKKGGETDRVGDLPTLDHNRPISAREVRCRLEHDTVK